MTGTLERPAGPAGPEAGPAANPGADDVRARWQALARTGAGTPMGELLRRYWWPVAGASELDRDPVRPVRLLGEDLVLYRDLGGAYGLQERHCLHRGADLAHGYVEERGLRCSYHGWLYGEGGRCVARPFEDASAARRARDGEGGTDGRGPDGRREGARLRLRSYPVAEHGGLVWAYLGPEPAPLVPDWEFFGWPNGFRQIVVSEIPCNWLQCQENSIDPVHFEWAHANWGLRLGGRLGPYCPTHVRLGFTEFEHGFRYRRVREDTDETDRFWTVGRVCLWPAALFAGGHVEYRVPVDDENTLSVTWHFSRVPKDRDPYVQGRIPTWHGPVRDPATGRWITSHIMNQDFVAWVGQGRVADRSREHLGASDRGIVMVRRRFLDDLERVARGEDPKAVVRDPALNRSIPLPIAERRHVVDGLTREEFVRDPICAATLGGYILQAGQPPEVRAAFLEAMGFQEGEAGEPGRAVDILAPRPA